MGGLEGAVERGAGIATQGIVRNVAGGDGGGGNGPPGPGVWANLYANITSLLSNAAGFAPFLVAAVAAYSSKQKDSSSSTNDVASMEKRCTELEEQLEFERFLYEQNSALNANQQLAVDAARESSRAVIKESVDVVTKLADSVYEEKIGFLNGLHTDLLDRQDIYCSPFKRRKRRLVTEDRLLNKAANSSYNESMYVYSGVSDIIENDTSCGDSRLTNGKLMWIYLKYWRELAANQRLESIQSQLHTVLSESK